MTLPIILDCDPGVDDAVAVLLALKASSRLNVLGITTVAGNVGLAKTTRNACILRQVAGRADVPIFAGHDRPLTREPVLADDFHGPEGLGHVDVFTPDKGAESQSGTDFIISILRSTTSKTVTLAVTGPLTNIAAALKQAPDIKDRIGQIVLMGGARTEGGNITASAEYNIYADPEAADIVFQCGCRLVVLGLDATHQVRGTPQRIAKIEALGNEVAVFAAETLKFSNTLPGNMEGADGAPLHDPCVIAFLLAPELFVLKPCSIQVETVSNLTRGHTAVEFRPDYWGVPFNAEWVTHVDADGVFALLERAFAS